MIIDPRYKMAIATATIAIVLIYTLVTIIASVTYVGTTQVCNCSEIENTTESLECSNSTDNGICLTDIDHKPHFVNMSLSVQNKVIA